MKNPDEPIFQRAVVAAAFSPRLSAVLNEAHRLLRQMGTWPIIVHVGEGTSAERSKLEDAIDQSNFKTHPPICLIRNGNPVDVLIDVAKEYNADLIVAGALKKEGMFQYYLGSVARKLARNAPCSVMLFTEPQVKPHPIEKIHCAVEYDKEAMFAVDVAIQFGKLFNPRELYFTHSFSPRADLGEQLGSKVSDIKNMFSREDTQLKEFISNFPVDDISYRTQCLYEKKRDTSLAFTREVAADLFIVHGPRNSLGLWDRLFPQDFERTLQNLPCSLLLTRK